MQNYTFLDKLQLSEESPINKGPSNIQNRARVKWSQTPKLNLLLNYATSIKDNTKDYQRGLNCASHLVYDNGKYKSHYCFTRGCNVCNRIRTGQLINKYEDDFNALKEPYFVTLTAPNVEKHLLNDEIKRMQSVIRKIANNGRKYGVLFKGVRKLEITYNINKSNYHPHFHFIVDGEIEAGYLLEKWLKYNPDSNRAAQDMKRADKGTLKELFKYAVKDTDTKRAIPIDALHHILKTLKGKRTFQSMGYFAQGIDELESNEPILIAEKTNSEDRGSFVWNDNLNDWINSRKEKFSNYKPTKKDIIKRNKYEKLSILYE